MFVASERCVLVHSFFFEGGACCVNRNVSGSLGNYFMVVMLHSLVYFFV